MLTTLGHLACGLAATLLYTWVTPERNPADPQDWFGIANPTDPSAGTPDTAAFAAGLRGRDPAAVRAGAGARALPDAAGGQQALALAALERQRAGPERRQGGLDGHLAAMEPEQPGEVEGGAVRGLLRPSTCTSRSRSGAARGAAAR